MSIERDIKLDELYLALDTKKDKKTIEKLFNEYIKMSKEEGIDDSNMQHRQILLYYKHLKGG